jgi:hypothetical protein
MPRISAVAYSLVCFVGGVCLVLGVGIGKSDIALAVANAMVTSLSYSIVWQAILSIFGLVLSLVTIFNLLKGIMRLVLGFVPFLSGMLCVSGLDKAGVVWIWLLVVPILIGVLTGATVTSDPQ